MARKYTPGRSHGMPSGKNPGAFDNADSPMFIGTDGHGSLLLSATPATKARPYTAAAARAAGPKKAPKTPSTKNKDGSRR